MVSGTPSSGAPALPDGQLIVVQHDVRVAPAIGEIVHLALLGNPVSVQPAAR